MLLKQTNTQLNGLWAKVHVFFIHWIPFSCVPIGMKNCHCLEHAQVREKLKAEKKQKAADEMTGIKKDYLLHYLHSGGPLFQPQISQAWNQGGGVMRYLENLILFGR